MSFRSILLWTVENIKLLRYTFCYINVTQINIFTVNSQSSGSPFSMLKQLRSCDLMILHAQKPAQVITMWHKFHLAQVERKKMASIDTTVRMGKVSAIMRFRNKVT